jgi:hypothetical protein
MYQGIALSPPVRPFRIVLQVLYIVLHYAPSTVRGSSARRNGWLRFFSASLAPSPLDFDTVLYAYL